MTAATPSSVPKSSMLNSWKEIATYLGRGVRSVQRYEQEFGLPVRRFSGKSHGSVMAFPSELDECMRVAACEKVSADPKLQTAATIEVAHSSLEAHVELRRQSRQLRSTHRETVSRLIETLTVLVKNSRP